ncbi:MAG: TOBE domain-containing protein [Campylobacterota bacterium]|nr:TOBE domain-containing protein [Campylobacterota bacterium]
MNHIKARITNIQEGENLSIVSFEVQGHLLKMMALGLSLPVGIGSEVILGAKASNIAIAKEFSGNLSISNRLHVKIEKIQKGELLCAIFFRFDTYLLESIITRDSADAMDLHVNDSIIALIKSSEISIIEVLS